MPGCQLFDCDFHCCPEAVGCLHIDLAPAFADSLDSSLLGDCRNSLVGADESEQCSVVAVKQLLAANLSGLNSLDCVDLALGQRQLLLVDLDGLGIRQLGVVLAGDKVDIPALADLNSVLVISHHAELVALTLQQAALIQAVAFDRLQILVLGLLTALVEVDLIVLRT